jgi:hypothetical protein
MEIRIPLKRIIAGDYKVGLTPHTAGRDGGWVTVDGQVLTFERRGQEYGHEEVAIENGLGKGKLDAIAKGNVRWVIVPELKMFGFQAAKDSPRVRTLMLMALPYAPLGFEINIDFETGLPKSFATPTEARQWLENKTVLASSEANVEGDPSLIYTNGGWIDADGLHHALARYEDLHEKLIVALGYDNSKEALLAGCIRVAAFSVDYMLEFHALTASLRSRAIDFLQGGQPDFAVTLEWYAPKHGNDYFRSVDKAVDALENRSVFASAENLEDAINWESGRPVVARGGELPASGPIFLTTDPQMALDYGEGRQVATYTFDKDSLLLEGSVEWEQNFGEAYEDGPATYTDPPQEILDYIKKKNLAGFASGGGTIVRIEDRNRAGLKLLKVWKNAKVAISLPKLVQETNAFSVKNRPGCSATLTNSNPKDLFLEYNVKCNLKDSDPAGHDVRVHFDVSKVEETEKAKDLDVRVSCACPAFLYWGGQWNLHQRDGLEGEPRPLLQAPTERLDLRSNFVICKHCKAVFERILPAVQNNINNILRKIRVKQYEEEVKEKGIKPPTIKRQPGQLSPEDQDVAQKLREGIEQREREKLLKEQSIVQRTPEVVEVVPKKPSEEPLEELEPYLPEKEFEDLKNLEDAERKKLLQQMPPLPVEEPETGKVEEHPDKPHLHTGLPYERKEEPKWKQWVNKLKDRVKKWKGQEEKPPYRKFTSKKPKYVRVERYSDPGREEGYFYAPKGQGREEYGPVKTEAMVDTSEMYRGDNSRVFAEEENLLNTPIPADKIQEVNDFIDDLRELEPRVRNFPAGVKTLGEFLEYSDYSEEEQLADHLTQRIAAEYLAKRGYKGAIWSVEDFSNPVQYQIWDRSIIKQRTPTKSHRKSMLLRNNKLKKSSILDFRKDCWYTRDGKIVPVGDETHDIMAVGLVADKFKDDPIEAAMRDGNIRVGVSHSRSNTSVYFTIERFDASSIGLLKRAFSEGLFPKNLSAVAIYWGPNVAEREKYFSSPEEARDWVDSL